jgi:hypothetical protein
MVSTLRSLVFRYGRDPDSWIRHLTEEKIQIQIPATPEMNPNAGRKKLHTNRRKRRSLWRAEGFSWSLQIVISKFEFLQLPTIIFGIRKLNPHPDSPRRLKPNPDLTNMDTKSLQKRARNLTNIGIEYPILIYEKIFMIGSRKDKKLRIRNTN